VRAGE
jgi:hypothetical protein